MNQEKQLLRQKFRLQRSQLPEEVRRLKDHLIFERLIQDSAVQNANLILAYASCRHEPDTWEFIRCMLKQSIPIALPKCGRNGQMQFFVITSTADLQTGAYQILEPVTNQKAVITEKTVCIVPGIAFTKDGIRLGQGGGYYDRFLKSHPELYTIGIGYDFMIQDSLPCEAHDCRMNRIITDVTEVYYEV